MSLGQTSVASLDVEGVTLSTVHTMKGQQAVVVFLVGMDEGTFPDYRAIKKGNNSIEMQQEKNNLYVSKLTSDTYLVCPKQSVYTIVCLGSKLDFFLGDQSPQGIFLF